MEDLEVTCRICDFEYSDDRTPRNLPCGHSMCTLCVDEVLARDGKCPECRARITASTSDELPIGYTLLTMSCWLTKNRDMQQKEDSSPKVVCTRQADAGKCEDHGSYLFFRCQTCDVWMCRDCLVDHPEPPRGLCRTVTFSTALAEAKETYAKAARIENIMIILLKDELNELKSHLLEKEKQHQTEVNALHGQVYYIISITDWITRLLKTLESCPNLQKTAEDCVAHAKTPRDLMNATQDILSCSDSLKLLVIEARKPIKQFPLNVDVSNKIILSCNSKENGGIQSFLCSNLFSLHSNSSIPSATCSSFDFGSSVSPAPSKGTKKAKIR